MPHYSQMSAATADNISNQIANICKRYDSPTYRRRPGQEDFPYKSHENRGWSKRHALLEAQNHRCAYCGDPVRVTNRHGDVGHDVATIDEVVPKVQGGRPIWSNQVIACFFCNQSKGALRADVWLMTVTTMDKTAAALWAAREHSKAASFGFHVLA